MKYFKYWVKENFEINIDGNIKSINILSGSNDSKDSASKEAKVKADKIEQRISEKFSKDEYDASIKEHVSAILDDANIVSVCRYGALILNTTEYTILDLDDYPFHFMDWFRSSKKATKKEKIVLRFLEKIKRHSILGNDFRIYETAKGIRVIGKKYFDPSDKLFSSLMRKLAVDWIYIQLSKKQKCYRARLTPKPYRMGIKTIKIRDPLDCETQNYLHWSEEYKKQSKHYSVVKLVTCIGKDFSHEPAIKFHDDTCNLQANNTLA